MESDTVRDVRHYGWMLPLVPLCDCCAVVLMVAYTFKVVFVGVLATTITLACKSAQA